MKTALLNLKYTIASLLLAVCLLLNTNMLVAQEEEPEEEAAMAGVGMIEQCLEEEELVLCVYDFTYEDATEGFMITIDCDEEMDVEILFLPVSVAAKMDLDEDGEEDDLQLTVPEEVAEDFSWVFELVANPTADCIVSITDVGTNSLAIADDEIPPVLINPGVGTVDVDMITKLKQAQFYWVKPNYPGGNSTNLKACGGGPTNPTGTTLNIQNCSSKLLSFFSLIPVKINNWAAVESGWNIEKVTFADSKCDPYNYLSSLGIKNNGELTIDFNDVYTSYNDPAQYTLNFNTANKIEFDFVTNEKYPCTSGGKLLNMPLAITIKGVSNVLNATNKTNARNNGVNMPTEAKIYPNPCYNELHITAPVACNPESKTSSMLIRVMNSKGEIIENKEQLIYKDNFLEQTLNTNAWENGMYYCAIYQEGVLQLVEKILKIK